MCVASQPGMNPVNAGGIISGLSYAADCYVNDREMKLDEAILSIGFGVLSGKISGAGANKNVVLNNTIENAKHTVARETRRANQQYANKVIASTIRSRNDVLSSAALISSSRFAAASGAANGGMEAYRGVELLPDAPAWKPW